MIFQANGNQKVSVAILISNKIDFQPKVVTKVKEENFMVIKGSIHKEDKAILKICALNIQVAEDIKQILTDLMGEIDYNAVIVGDFDIPLSGTNHSDRKSLRKHWD